MKKKQQLAILYLVNCVTCLFMFISIIFTKHSEVALFASIILGATVLIKVKGNKEITAANLKRERVLTEVNPTEVLGGKIRAAWDRFIYWLNN
jgi:hypothetical protein